MNGLNGINQGKFTKTRKKYSKLQVFSFHYRGVPSDQFPRGREANYEPLYVIRAEHNGQLMPGKFNADRQGAYVAYWDKEISVPNFEFLTAKNVKWQPSSNGNPISRSVDGGRTSYGETLYICRVRHNGSIVPGKAHLSQRGCHVPYDGKELKFKDYEQLVYT
jgi:Protein of unknown function (DUF3421)